MTIVLAATAETYYKSMKSYGKKIWDIIRSITINTENYDEKYMKLKLNSDGDLPVRKMWELRKIIITARVAFHEGNKYFSQILLDECFYKLNTKIR